MPTISVILPVYNGERTILDTIASVQKQTFSDFELIVINDGATDGTLGRVSTIQDPRLKVFSYSDGYPSLGRNRGISHATGEFIAFIDADDLWTPDKLELQLTTLRQHPEAGLAYSWVLSMDDNGEYLHPGISVSHEGNVYPNLLLSNFIATGSNPLLRRDALKTVGVFDPELYACEDWDYWLRVASRWSFVVVRKHQVLYRQTSESMSSNIDMVEQYYTIVLEKAFATAPPELQHLKEQSLANKYYFIAQLCLNRNASVEATKLAKQKLQKAIRLYPKILLNTTTHVLLMKLLLNELLHPSIASSIFQQISKRRTIKSQFCSIPIFGKKL